MLWVDLHLVLSKAQIVDFCKKKKKTERERKREIEYFV